MGDSAAPVDLFSSVRVLTSDSFQEGQGESERIDQ
jgi:hypothetical protein